MNHEYDRDQMTVWEWIRIGLALPFLLTAEILCMVGSFVIGITFHVE